MLPSTVSENRQLDRCPIRLSIGHSKITHGHYMSRKQLPTYEDWEDTPLRVKSILWKPLTHNNRRRQFFGSTNKTMKPLLSDGDTTYGGTLFKLPTLI